MENNQNNSSKNKKVKSKNLKSEMLKFYKEELKVKHKWIFVISLFLYIASLISFKTGMLSLESINNMILSKSEVNVYSENNVSVYENDIYEANIYGTTNQFSQNVNTNVKKETTRFDMLKQQLALSAVTVISGLTPFVNIPVIVAIVYPISYAYTISTLEIVQFILLSIMGILEIFIISLLVSIGMYFCKMSTKHFRYNESSSFTLNDVRLQFNEAMKRNEKVEEIKKKMDEKYEKIKKLNEKTNYKMIVCFSILATILLLICTLITGV